MRARFHSTTTEYSSTPVSTTKKGSQVAFEKTVSIRESRLARGSDDQSDENDSLEESSVEEDSSKNNLKYNTSMSSERKLRFTGSDEKKVSLPTSRGMRLEQRACPQTCEKFLKVKEFAKIFVEGIIDDALLRGKELRHQSSVHMFDGLKYSTGDSDDTSSSSLESVGTYIIILEWPTIAEFTPDLGVNKIDEYLSYWKTEESWKYCINYLKGESDQTSDYHRYEAIFSIPCKQYPVPQATASVYFTFEVSRVRPKHCLTDIYYWFEGQKLIHTPGKFIFQESWLFNIIDAKINFYKKCTY